MVISNRIDRDTFASRRVSPFLLYSILYTVSFLFGILSVKFNFVFYDDGEFSSLLSSIINSNYVFNFLSFLINNTVFVVLMVLCGYFTFGVIINCGLFVCHAIGSGALFACVCKQCGAIGIAVNLTIFLIPSIMLFILFTLTSTSSAYFSNGLAVAVFSNRSLIGIKSRMFDMLKLLLIVIPCIAAASALRALFIMIFSGVFFA